MDRHPLSRPDAISKRLKLLLRGGAAIDLQPSYEEGEGLYISPFLIAQAPLPTQRFELLFQLSNECHPPPPSSGIVFHPSSVSWTLSLRSAAAISTSVLLRHL